MNPFWDTSYGNCDHRACGRISSEGSRLGIRVPEVSYAGCPPTSPSLDPHHGLHDPQQDLSSLLQMIGNYEQAIGRMYLYTHRLKMVHGSDYNSTASTFLESCQSSWAAENMEKSESCPNVNSENVSLSDDTYSPSSSHDFLSSPSWTSSSSETLVYDRVPGKIIPTTPTTEDPWQQHNDSANSWNTKTAKAVQYLMSADVWSGDHLSHSSCSNLPEPSENDNDSIEPQDQTKPVECHKESKEIVSIKNPDLEHQPQKSVYASTRIWTREVDELLRQEVAAQMNAGVEPLQWTKIARRIGKRSGVQCQARWAEVLDEKISKGRWKVEEDTRLRSLYQQYGGQWSKIASHMVTRTQRQCRSRWLQMNNTV